MLMTTIEQSMWDAGFARSPNEPTKWYAGSAGMKEPAFPLELRITDAIWLVTRPYGQEPKEVIPLMRFDDVAGLKAYLAGNHRIAQAGAPFSNAWD